MRVAPPWALAVAALAVVAAPAVAEHEVFFRYTVLGYVKDTKGRSVAGQTVKVVRDKTGFAYTVETDPKGLYMLVLRLGDESAGEPLTLTIGRLEHRVTARFDPKNQVDERG